jgi:predicted permease
VNVGDVLRRSGRGASTFRLARLTAWLVAGEVALSCALLVVTGLMVSGVLGAVGRHAALGAEHVLSARVDLSGAAYTTRGAQPRFLRALAEAAAARPGVRAVTIASTLPGFAARSQALAVEGRLTDPARRPLVSRVTYVGPGFFGAFGASVAAGRDLAWSDDERATPVAIVNQRFVALYFADGEPLGRRLRVSTDTDSLSRGPWVTIVGVVPSLGTRRWRGSEDEMIYLPILQHHVSSPAIAVRTAGDPLALLPDLRAAVRALDADVPMYDEGRLDRQLSRATAGEKVFGGLFTFFGAAALVLASVGLFGVVAFTVRLRWRELGIRIALGARRRSVLALVMRGAAIQLGGGLVIGLGLAALVSPLIGEALMGADPRNVAVYASIALLLALAGGMAAWLPARRALQVSPSEALRSE